jgi:1-acyl-sn-glycerol-3-phosphate acyltransferase
MAHFMMMASPKWKINIQGEDNFDPEIPTIFIANHQSFLDMALTYHLPWQMKWVSKRSLAMIPVMGWLVWLTGHLTINRKSKSALKRLDNLVQPLRDKIPVMIFPEGTRTLDGNLKRFKNGAFLLAKEHNFNVQPMVLDGGHIAMKSGSKVVDPKVNFTISVLKPIKTSDFKDLNTLKDHAYELIEKELQQIRSV